MSWSHALHGFTIKKRRSHLGLHTKMLPIPVLLVCQIAGRSNARADITFESASPTGLQKAMRVNCIKVHAAGQFMGMYIHRAVICILHNSSMRHQQRQTAYRHEKLPSNLSCQNILARKQTSLQPIRVIPQDLQIRIRIHLVINWLLLILHQPQIHQLL